MNKKGLTLLSMVIYVALFFTFMTFATIIATNMNYTSLSYKGKIVNEENFQKLQYNILNSAKRSVSVDKLYNSVVFSNNDEYSYNEEKEQVLKNGGVIATNVTSFEIANIESLKDVPSSFFTKSDGKYINLDKSKDYICINITFEKYGAQTTSQIFAVVGDDIDE